MKKIYILVFFSLSISLSFTANAIVSIIGKVIDDSSNEPLEYANVVLLSFPDSIFVSGSISDENGIFKLDNITNGAYLLKVSYVGFEVKFISVKVVSEPVVTNDIRLVQSNILDEIVVTPKVKPFRTGTGGAIIANVSTTLLSTVGTANDVLQRMPGILLDNNNITIFGKGAPIIYINNRLVRDKQELERLESTEISSIELITNPGAKYDAEGRAVLLIKTKNKINGFSAQITERIRKGNYLGDNENVSISYVKDKLNLFTSYNHQYAKRKADEYHHYMIRSDSLWNHNISMPGYVYSNESHQLSVGVDYSLNEKHAIGGEYQYYISKGKDSTQINSTTLSNNSLYDEIISKALMSQKPNRHLLNIFYNGKLSDRFSLRLDFDYLKNHDFTNQFSHEISNTELRTVNTTSQTDYRLIAGKLTNSYSSTFGMIEFGGEYNDIFGDGYMLNPEGYINDNDFTNSERKAAGFINYLHDVFGINISTGIRFEYASVQFTEGSKKNVITEKKYNDIYPSISLSKQVKNADLSLSINKRTQRPTFRQLNGNTYYINRFSYQKGNPYLTKYDIFDVNLRSIYKQLYLNFGYVSGRNPIIIEFQKQGSNAFLSTYENYPQFKEINVTLNYSSKFSFWQPNYTMGARKQFFTYIYDEYKDNYNKSNYFIRIYNDFTLPYTFILSCNYMYYSDVYMTNFKSKSYQQINVELRKSLFENRLRLNMVVNDVFNQAKDNTYIQMHDFKWEAEKKYETRYFQLTVSYYLNSYGKKYRGKSAAKDDLNRF